MKISNGVRLKRLKILLIVLIVISGLVPDLKAYAIEESASILMNLVPDRPGPNQNVDINLRSFAENLDTASISWFVDDKEIASGTGKKSISLITPALDSEVKVVAVITMPSGDKWQVTTIIKPSATVMLWQAEDSYVPPFYRGKALAPPDSFVKVVALPEIKVGGTLISPKNMDYSWEKDFVNAQNGAGFGRNSFIFKNDYLENFNNIGVLATTIDAKYTSKARIDIGMASPELSFYKKDPLLGINWDRALENNHRITGGETIFAAPYFISPKELLHPDLSFTWYINDIPVDVVNYLRYMIPVASQEGASGVSKLRLYIENNSKIFETADKTITIEF